MHWSVKHANGHNVKAGCSGQGEEMLSSTPHTFLAASQKRCGQALLELQGHCRRRVNGALQMNRAEPICPEARKT